MCQAAGNGSNTEPDITELTFEGGDKLYINDVISDYIKLHYIASDSVFP